MLGLEDVAAYKDLFSSEDWSAIKTGECDEAEVNDSSLITDQISHAVTIFDPPGEYRQSADRFELECDRCGGIGAARTEAEAQMIAKLHEALAATVAEEGGEPQAPRAS